MSLRVSIEGTNQVVEIDGPVLTAFREIAIGNVKKALETVTDAASDLGAHGDLTPDEAATLHAALSDATQVVQALLYIPASG